MSLRDIQKLITNTLNSDGRIPFAGVIGLNPSKTARSPKVWNPVIKQLLGEGKAEYLCFDVEADKLPALVDALKAHPNFLGFNVAVPYKMNIMNCVDSLDSTAKTCGAMNLGILQHGKIVGYNVDGVGWYQNLTQSKSNPFLSLPLPKESKVCLLGAGGAARAIAFQLAMKYEAIGKPEIVLVNRTPHRGKELCNALKRCNPYTNIHFSNAPPKDALLYVNASTVGQWGVVAQHDGTKTILEAYSPLATFQVVSFTEGQFLESWKQSAQSGIEQNNISALAFMQEVPVEAKFSDVVFNPLETTFLRHARETGHQTINGKGMNAWQAAEGFVEVLWEQLKDRYPSREEAKRDVVERMLQIP